MSQRSVRSIALGALIPGFLILGTGASAAGAVEAEPIGPSVPPTGEPAARFAPKPPDRQWRPDMRAARNYARGRRGDVRFAIVDLHGKMRKHHAGRKSLSASVIKAMFLAAYLRRNSVEDRRLTQADKNLLGPMIRASDNGAATMVRNIVGSPAVNRLARRVGMRHFSQRAAWGLSRISAHDQALFFHRLDAYIPDRHQGYAWRLLGSIVPSQRWGVARVRPPGWDLYFKGGWGIGANVNNQVAFLERGRCRTSLAILTEGSPSHFYGTQTLRGVANRLLRGLGKKSIKRACDRA